MPRVCPVPSRLHTPAFRRQDRANLWEPGDATRDAHGAHGRFDEEPEATEPAREPEPHEPPD
jgi:hypothetical protein